MRKHINKSKKELEKLEDEDNSLLHSLVRGLEDIREGRISPWKK